MTYPRLGSKHFRYPTSFDEWRLFLVEHRAPPSTIQKPEFGGTFAFAMRKRWDWLQEALTRSVPYPEAELAFSDAVNRARGQEQAAAGEPNARAVRRSKREESYDDLVAHARDLGL